MRARENRDRLYTAGEAAPPAQPFGRTVAHVRATAVAFGVRGPPASLAQSLIDHRLRGWPRLSTFEFLLGANRPRLGGWRQSLFLASSLGRARVHTSTQEMHLPLFAFRLR